MHLTKTEGISGNDKMCHIVPYKVLKIEKVKKPSFWVRFCMLLGLNV